MPPGLRLKTIVDVAAACDTDLSILNDLLSHTDKYYTHFEIPKSNGTRRMITPSTGILKRAQTWLLDYFNSHLSWSKAVHGGIKHRSIFTNAARHVGQFCVGTMDIASFFPKHNNKSYFSCIDRYWMRRPSVRMHMQADDALRCSPTGCPDQHSHGEHRTSENGLVLYPIRTETRFILFALRR